MKNDSANTPMPAESPSGGEQALLRDIIALSTLPAMWLGAEPQRVAESLGAALYTTLNPEFLYVCLAAGSGRAAAEVTQTERYQTTSMLPADVKDAIRAWSRSHDPDDLLILRNPLGPGSLRVTTRPVVSHAELGVIAAAFSDPGAPTKAHHLLLNVGASQAAIAISNSVLLRSLRESEEQVRQTNDALAERVAEQQKVNIELQEARSATLNILEQLRKRGERQQLLSDTLAQLLSARDPETVVRELFPKVAAHTGADTYFNFMLDERQDALYLHSCAGIPESEARSIQRLEFGAAICGTVAESRRPIHATDIQHSDYDKAALVRGFGIQSYACSPLLAGDRLLGTLSFASHTRTAFDDEELEFLGTITQFAAIALERLQRAEQLRQSEERFRSLVSVITNVPWVADARGAFIARQAAWETYTGQRWEEHQGFGWMNAFHPDDRDQVERVWKEACASGSLYQSEGRLWHAPSHSWRYFTARATPLMNADASVREWIGTCTDVDEQKRGREWLELQVAERTRELQQANEALLRDMAERKKLEEQLVQSQKMESVGVLAGGIAHDFNNILNIIQGYAFLMNDNGGADEEIRNSLAIINETVQRGSALVQQLLTLARKSDTKLESVNPNQLVEGLVRLIRQTFPKTIDLSFSPAADPPSVMADKNQLEQALLNLCVNARDAMPFGGRLNFRIQAVNGATLRSFGANPRQPFICIAVADSGAGMDEGVRKRIFEPFFTTKDKGQGTGLGLSVVYGIVKNHDGFIDVASKPGSGTTFRLYFPVSAADAVSEDRASPARANLLETDPAAAILLVEDEEEMLEVLKRILSRRGYQIFTAKNGAMALEIYQRHKQVIDVVLLDMGLPKIDGREVLLKLKSLDPDIDIIVASGYLEPGLKSEIDRAGVTFLHKPYRPDAVVKTLQSVLAKKFRPDRSFPVAGAPRPD